MRCKDIVEFAFRNGWAEASDGSVSVSCENIKPLTAEQKKLLGNQDDEMEALDDRLPAFRFGEIVVASAFPKEGKGHGCDLFVIPTPEGWRLAARCDDRRKTCSLGRLSKAALESGDFSRLPLLEEVNDEEGNM